MDLIGAKKLIDINNTTERTMVALKELKADIISSHRNEYMTI